MHRGIWLTAGILITALVLATVCATPQPAQAQLPAPQPTNPPPTWTPGPPQDKTTPPPVAGTDTDTAAGVLTLQVQCDSGSQECADRLPVLWTQVESQNPDGSWVPVTGWAGRLARIEGSRGRLSWWFGTQALAPLRWVIREGAAGDALAVSDSFQPAPSSAMVVVINLPSSTVLLPASGHAVTFTVGALVCLIVLCLASISGRTADPIVIER